MGLRINTNIQALNAHKNLIKTDNALSSSLERLSSGLRINKAADDASGLAIANTLKAQHTGIGQAISNASDGVNIIQIADGALEESTNIVNTIRTKAIQAASDAQSAASRKAIQADVTKLLEELNMIAETTAYNGINLLDGTFTDKQFHIGAYKDETANVNIGNASGKVVGAMAYANTARQAEASVSKPFFKGDAVTTDKLEEGDLRINGIEIGKAGDQFVFTGTTAASTTAFAKAAAINAKVNETGVQAKATTETIFTFGAANGYMEINGVSLTTSGGAQAVANDINNNLSAQQLGIRAEYIANGTTNGALKVVGMYGQEVTFSNATGSILVNGQHASGSDFKAQGTLTLSNARAMTQSTEGISEVSLSAGDLTINGIDVAQGGALSIKKDDSDHTLLNAINNNSTFQKMGVRAEYVSMDDGLANRIRIISENDQIVIGGADPGKVNLEKGATQGIQTNGIVLEGSATDTDKINDNYLSKIGFSGAQYGSFEPSGVGNQSGNDLLVLSGAYLKTDAVSTAKLEEGDIRINGIEIGAAGGQFVHSGATAVTTSTTAFAKAAAINAKVNETGVQAKATTETIFTFGDANGYMEINGVSLTTSGGAQAVANDINNNLSAQQLGIRAEYIANGTTNGALKVVGMYGQEVTFSNAKGSILVNGQHASGSDFKAQGTLTLSNARAMVGSEDKIEKVAVNSGDFVINGVDIASGGALNIEDNDNDHTLLNAINDNTELQQMGIRAEYYSTDDGVSNRIRLISANDDITISGTDPSKLNFVKGTTEGITTTEMRIEGAAVDSDKSNDNYLSKIGLSGSINGTSEADGSENSGGNDVLIFGNDRMRYDSGDIAINGYNIGQPSDDGISHALGDRSAAAWAEAINSISKHTGVEADIIKAQQTGAGTVTAGILQQGDLKINGVDIVRDNTGGNGMQLKNGDADHTLINAINEYKDQTGVMASIDKDGALVLNARDGRNIHVQSTATGNKNVKFASDFGNVGVAQDSVYMGNIRLVANEAFTVDGAGSNAGQRELSLGKVGLAGGGASTEATSDLKGDGTILAGLNYSTAIAYVDVTTQEGAEMAIRTADYALERLDEIRSGLGSTQNQLTSTIANLSVTKINVQATESAMRDVDFAAESTQFSKMQVLMQAGTYAQSQANATAQNVMRLLQ
ncbi:MAG: flagellin [Desulforegulaceae bacterium]|nr:flagellin [Desulforegulaceae bacterium]